MLSTGAIEPTPLKAPALRPGDSVAIVSPAGPPDSSVLDQGVRFLSECGYKPVLGKHVLDRHGYLSGSDNDRITDFNLAIHNSDIRAIFCSRGGYGSARIIPAIDFAALKKDPKIIVGFSDVTALLSAIWNECGLITFHGPLIGSRHYSKRTWNHLFAQITTSAKVTHQWSIQTDNLPAAKWHPHKGVTRSIGRTFGGCLSILATLAGTPWGLNDISSVLFLEDIGEAPYRIDRMITHLFHAGWFENTSAVLFGEFVACVQRNDDPEPTFLTETVIEDSLRKITAPAWTGLPFGHGKDTLTIPVGVTVQVDCKGITQLESGVELPKR